MKNVLPGVVTTPASLTDSQHEISNTRVVDLIKKHVQERISQFIAARNADPRHLGSEIQSVLQGLVSNNSIRSIDVVDVEVGHSKPFTEVNWLPVTALPGDPLIDEETQPDGTVKEVFKGIVVSSDGQGNGVVFRAPDLGSGGVKDEIRVRCKVQPIWPLEYIIVDVKNKV